MPKKVPNKKFKPEIEQESGKKVASADRAKSLFLSLKSLLLSLLLVFLLAMIKNINSYGRMYNKHISASYEDMAEIRDLDNYNDIEVRKQKRWGKGYRALKGIQLRIKDTADPIVLVPPNPYIKMMNPSFELPEPAVSYYYTGLKTVWGTSKYAYQSTHAFIVTKKGAGVIKIDRRQQIDSLLDLYKTFKYF